MVRAGEMVMRRFGAASVVSALALLNLQLVAAGAGGPGAARGPPASGRGAAAAVALSGGAVEDAEADANRERLWAAPRPGSRGRRAAF